MAEKNNEFFEKYKPIVDVLMDKQALEVNIHDLSEVSGFTEAFIIAIARSDLHARTLRDAVEEFMEQAKLNFSVEGANSTKWCLVDAGHVIVNILSKEGSQYYRLDSLWGDAPTMKYTDSEELDKDLFK